MLPPTPSCGLHLRRPHLSQLRYLGSLLTFAATAGCSPMIILLDDEADAFWCFEHLMRRLL
ncbi:hypothetical protein PIB30_028383 [Stylosanthes scabra]|uniref:Rab-GAP TBC domain-containing protein n=1 Tax=Stylosanthes scabra TaxID=79078 RepID=A0ABU6SB19_9FABA|nr:hypothetical protein [Stylosanthes scabra]